MREGGHVADSDAVLNPTSIYCKYPSLVPIHKQWVLLIYQQVIAASGFLQYGRYVLYPDPPSVA